MKKSSKAVLLGLAWFVLSSPSAYPTLQAQQTEQESVQLTKEEQLQERANELVRKLVTYRDDTRADDEKELAEIGKLAIAPLIELLSRRTSGLYGSMGARRRSGESAARLLGIIGDESAIDPLIKALEDPYRNIREAALEALVKFDDPRVVPALGNALANRTLGLERQIIQALGELKNPAPAIPYLVERLNESDPNVKKAAAEALDKTGWHPTNVNEAYAYRLGRLDWGWFVEQGETSVPFLVSLLGKIDPRQIPSVGKALYSIGDAGISTLIEALDSPDTRVQASVIIALGETGSSKAVPSLLRKSKDTPLNVRLAAIRSLGHFENPEVVDALGGMVQDEEESVRKAALESLGRFEHAGILPFAAQAVADEEADIRRLALRILEQKPDESYFDVTAGALGDEDPYVRRQAADTLAEFNDPRAVGLLVPILDDEFSPARAAAARALSALGWKPTLEEEIVKDLIARERESSLSRMGTAAIEILVSDLDRQSYTVRGFAEKALNRFPFEAVKDVLIQRFGSANEDGRNTIVRILGPHSEDPDVLEVLIRALTDEDYSVRARAAGALKNMEWEPQDPKQKAAYSFARREWSTLAELGDFAVDLLVAKGLTAESEYVRKDSARVLKGFGWTPADPMQEIAFLLLLRDKDGLVAKGEPALTALIAELKVHHSPFALSVLCDFLENSRAFEALVAALENESPAVREMAAEKLSELWITDQKWTPELFGAVLQYPRCAEGYRRALHQEKLDEKTFAELLSEVESPTEKQWLTLLYYTRQAVGTGVTDAALYHWMVDWAFMRGVNSVLDHAAVSEHLSVLNSCAPEKAAKLSGMIAAAQYLDTPKPLGALGMTTWAAGSANGVISAVRRVELARRSVVLRLLVQEGMVTLPETVSANFSWSGVSSIPIHFPPMVWSEDDVPQLKQFLTSEHELHRKAAQKALDSLREAKTRCRDLEEIVELLHSIHFADRYLGLHLLNMRDEVPGSILRNILRVIEEEDNYWINEVAEELLIKAEGDVPSVMLSLMENQFVRHQETAVRVLLVVVDRSHLDELFGLLEREGLAESVQETLQQTIRRVVMEERDGGSQDAVLSLLKKAAEHEDMGVRGFANGLIEELRQEPEPAEEHPVDQPESRKFPAPEAKSSVQTGSSAEAQSVVEADSASPGEPESQDETLVSTGTIAAGVAVVAVVVAVAVVLWRRLSC
ncbi:MAG: HEAT repeat domain-containing protein [Planctomycetota bacterium]|jgi:HEAT repeat protein